MEITEILLINRTRQYIVILTDKKGKIPINWTCDNETQYWTFGSNLSTGYPLNMPKVGNDAIRYINNIIWRLKCYKNYIFLQTYLKLEHLFSSVKMHKAKHVEFWLSILPRSRIQMEFKNARL